MTAGDGSGDAGCDGTFDGAIPAVDVPDPQDGGGALARIGVAIPVPAPLGEVLQRCRAGTGDPLAWSVPTHVTLVPPVEVADGALPQVHEHLARAAAGSRAFDIELRGTGTFRPVSPVVFVRLVSGAREVARIEEQVRSGVLGSRRRFPFHPHVTLAQDVGEEALDRVGEAMAGFSASFTADCLVLYRHDGGASAWRPVADFRLG